jgi:hypothetical protein
MQPIIPQLPMITLLNGKSLVSTRTPVRHTPHSRMVTPTATVSRILPNFTPTVSPYLLLVPGLLYNLFADAQLGLNLVPQSVYQMQSDFYPTVANEYGVPLDTRHTLTKGKLASTCIAQAITDLKKGDWECFVAAIASVSTRSMLIGQLATWLNETPTNRPLTDLYETVTGK